MASIFAHAVTAITLGRVIKKERLSPYIWILTILCSVLPDIDVVGFYFNIPYRALLGHRGLTHSFFFAVITATVALLPLFVKYKNNLLIRLWILLFLSTASHGLLDAMTNGGLGVAFFSPFSNTRYFLPFRPIQVSPIGISNFFSQWGIAVLKSELLWVGLPMAILIAGSIFWKKR